MRRDDFAAQLVGADFVFVFLQRLGEVAEQVFFHRRRIRNIAVQNTLVENDFDVGRQHRQFRAGQALPVTHHAGEGFIVRQPFKRALDKTGFFEVADKLGMQVDMLDRQRFLKGQRLGLLIVVAQNQRRNIVRHAFEQLVACLQRHFTAHRHIAEQDFDVHFVVGAIDTSRVVDKVRIDTPAAARIFNTRQLRNAEVCALAHHLGAHVACIDAHGIVGFIIGVGMALA